MTHFTPPEAFTRTTKRLRAAVAFATCAFLAHGAIAQVEKADLKFSLDWLFQGPQAPMVLAAEAGMPDRNVATLFLRDWLAPNRKAPIQ